MRLATAKPRDLDHVASLALFVVASLAIGEIGDFNGEIVERLSDLGCVLAAQTIERIGAACQRGAALLAGAVLFVGEGRFSHDTSASALLTALSAMCERGRRSMA